MTAPLLPGFDLAPPTAPVPAAVATSRAVWPVKPPAASPPPARLEMSPAWFAAKRFLAMLSPRERAAVAARPRFWSMAYLRRSDDADLDELP